jgi:TonB family protein
MPGGRVLSLLMMRRWSAAGVSVVVGLWLAMALFPLPALGQGELVRKPKVRVAPTYPPLARKMNIRGTVKLMVVVSPNGNLKETKVVGGNPILVDAALDALKKWKFEPADDESSGTLEFKFQPQ